MAKTIKFNLICDEKPVRTIEDLQNNFSIEDILEYYNNLLLHRWLRVRGYDDKLEMVNSISSENPMDIIKELIKIFDIIVDEEDVEESVYMLKYLDERKELCSIYEQQEFKTNYIIDDYQTGYYQLVGGIFENPQNIAIIKANIEEITKNYSWILELNHRDLYWDLRKKSKLAIICLLMNEKSRKYFLPIKKTNDSGEIVLDIDNDDENDKKKMYYDICDLISEPEFREELGENLLSFAGMTDGYWKDLEPKGKKFMIINMGSGDYVRSAGESGGDLSSVDVNGEFVMVDGIDYKSNSSTRELIYMEV